MAFELGSTGSHEMSLVHTFGALKMPLPSTGVHDPVLPVLALALGPGPALVVMLPDDPAPPPLPFLSSLPTSPVLQPTSRLTKIRESVLIPRIVSALAAQRDIVSRRRTERASHLVFIEDTEAFRSHSLVRHVTIISYDEMSRV